MTQILGESPAGKEGGSNNTELFYCDFVLFLKLIENEGSARLGLIVL